MSGPGVDYYFSLRSPWSYLGHAPFMALSKQHDLTIRWIPIGLLDVFPNSGGLPLDKRHPSRRAYRDVELQRWRDKRGVPLNLRPTHRAVDMALADRIVIALVRRGLDPDLYVRGAFAALWAHDRNLADLTTLAELVAEAGQDAEAVLAEARDPASADAYAANVKDALAAGVFGAPTYGRDGELFWGQDRLELLAEALGSGRPPYRAL